MAAYFSTRSNIRPLGWNDELYVVQGQPLALKVNGLGPNKQHLVSLTPDFIRDPNQRK